MKRRRSSRGPFALACCASCLSGIAPSAGAQSAASASAAPRVEARSADLLAVGVVHGDRMTIHLSRALDNAPLRDAVVTVTLRGVAYPTVAEADGSYTLIDKDLPLPGDAAVVFRIDDAQLHESLQAVIRTAPGAVVEEKSNARQMWWWALNFGVCIGFLVLFSRRKKGEAT